MTKPSKVFDLALPPAMWAVLEEGAELCDRPFGIYCEQILAAEIPRLGRDPAKARIYALPTTAVPKAMRLSVETTELVRDAGETLLVTGRCIAYTAMSNYWDRRGKRVWF